MSNKHHDLLGVPKHANQHRLSRLTMEVHTDELRIMASAVESYTDELIAALEAAEKRIAELSSLQGKPIAWESTTPVYVKFITDERYQRLRPGYKKWYKPYRCSQCAAAGKGE
ncbi:hypothetical protein [Enterobacter quasiroggenkampii]|uniref:hypothetical protein n=1 Tax=Enterobacter quasiroggenkampii TaxID=2497436 RepID=UPI00069D9321|nr:hypothetical protein [Enterobacter quasiroggenkampii]